MQGSSSGILPVNARAEVKKINLNYIDSFIFYSFANRLSNDIHFNLITEVHVVTSVSKLYIFIIYLYYRPFSPHTGNINERPFCRLIEAFVLDPEQRNIRWTFTGRRAFTGRKPICTIYILNIYVPNDSIFMSADLSVS